MHVEFVLTNPINRDFPGPDNTVVSKPANLVRLKSWTNEASSERLFSRFTFGLIENDAFVENIKDEGLIFSGPAYQQAGFAQTPQVEEELLLRKLCEFFKLLGVYRTFA